MGVEVGYSTGVSADSYLSLVVLGYLIDCLLMGIVLVRAIPLSRPNLAEPLADELARQRLCLALCPSRGSVPGRQHQTSAYFQNFPNHRTVIQRMVRVIFALCVAQTVCNVVACIHALGLASASPPLFLRRPAPAWASPPLAPLREPCSEPDRSRRPAAPLVRPRRRARAVHVQRLERGDARRAPVQPVPDGRRSYVSPLS